MKNQHERIEQYVLDTSAFLTLIEDEEGADMVHALLQRAKHDDINIFASFVSFMEVFYITLQERDAQEAHARLDLMAQLSIERVESSSEIGIIAGEFKAAHRISFADAWIAATAKFHQATLAHKDPEYEQIQDEVTLLSLPYK